MDFKLGAPLTPEPLTTGELQEIVGCEIGKKVLVYRHAGRTYWKHGEYWYDYQREAG